VVGQRHTRSPAALGEALRASASAAERIVLRLEHVPEPELLAEIGPAWPLL